MAPHNAPHSHPGHGDGRPTGGGDPHDHPHGDHPHGLDHAHARGGPSTTRAFAIAVGLNFAFTLVEVIAGILAGSMALVADAAHNLGDALGLSLAWGATILARAKPSTRRTYGYARSTILAALANALIIFAGVGAVAWEAVKRLGSPPPVEGKAMMVVAAVGVAVNAGTALLFRHDHDRDVNIRGAFLHLAGDAAVSLGVVVAGAVVWRTGIGAIDPAVSLIVAAIILVSTWKLLRDALDLAMDAAPDHIDPAAVRAYLEGLPEVKAVHDLHVWAMSTTDTALTAHLLLATATPPPHFLNAVGLELHSRFRIDHPTLQLEPPDSPAPCSMESHDGACKGVSAAPLVHPHNH